MYDDDIKKRADTYTKVPSSTEYIPRQSKEPRTLDLRALDEQAKREMDKQPEPMAQRPQNISWFRSHPIESKITIAIVLLIIIGWLLVGIFTGYWWVWIPI